MISSQLTTTEHRDARFKLAIVTSLGSKCATFVLQLLVIPLAVRILGPALFGVYSMLVASLNWIWSCGIGIGPSLTIATAHALKEGNQPREERYVSTAFHIICLIGMLLVLGFSIIAHYFGISDIFGDQYLIYAHDIKLGLTIIFGMLIGILLLGVVEGAMAGHQEQYIINFCAMIGNLCSAAVLLVVLLRAPSVVGMILCMTCVAYLPRILTAIAYVIFIRPHWMPKFKSFDIPTAKVLIGTGAAFSIMQMGQFMKHEIGILFIGRILGPVPVAGYAILVNLCLLGFGAISMQTAPLLPAITDAIANGEYEWIRGVYSRGIRYAMVYACLVGLVLAVAGNLIIRIWYGPSVAPSVPLQVAIGIAFMLQVWEMYHIAILQSLGRAWIVVMLYLGQTLVFLVLCVPSIERFGSAGVPALLCITILLCDAWMLPILMGRTLGRYPSLGVVNASA